MSAYSNQGSKTRDLGGGVKAPRQGECPAIIREAEKPTCGIVGDAGIGKDGIPIKGGK